jgi:hypothetical protein
MSQALWKMGSFDISPKYPWLSGTISSLDINPDD